MKGTNLYMVNLFRERLSHPPLVATLLSSSFGLPARTSANFDNVTELEPSMGSVS